MELLVDMHRLRGRILLLAGVLLIAALIPAPTSAQRHRYDVLRFGGDDPPPPPPPIPITENCPVGQIVCFGGDCYNCGSTASLCPDNSVTFRFNPLLERTCDALGEGTRVCKTTVGGIEVEGACLTARFDDPPERGRSTPCSPIVCAPLQAVVGTCGQVGSACTLEIEGTSLSGTCVAALSGTIYCQAPT
jgi:hypothetical protein